MDKQPEDLRAAILNVFDEYHRAEYNADDGTVISLFPYADKAVRLCEAAALAALPGEITKDVDRMEHPIFYKYADASMYSQRDLDLAVDEAIATAQANIHSVFEGTQ